MLCSGQSSSNWLDRLRSNKGFPAADNLDLDDFLKNSPLNNPSNSESTQSDSKRVTTDLSQAVETSGGMANVLCDLFNMGDPISRFSGKKSARKQTNPKFRDIESMRKDEYVQAATASLHSDNNSNIGTNVDCGDDDVEKCGSDRELKGYSRSEVTVIDTSFEVWKVDKLIFRRMNVWKVRDKKGKSWTFGAKKRKGNHLESANGNASSKKKAKDSKGGDFVLPSNDGQKSENEIREEICKDTVDDHFQVCKERNHFSRLPRKSKKNGSSVILIKTLPASKKCGRNLPKNRLKDTQRQYKA